MGIFSWVTQDSHKKILIKTNEKESLHVFLVDNKGNYWEEKNYKGYGVFGGKNFFELVAEMNDKEDKLKGIDMFYSEDSFLSPNIVESKNWEWVNQRPCNLKF